MKVTVYSKETHRGIRVFHMWIPGTLRLLGTVGLRPDGTIHGKRGAPVRIDPARLLAIPPNTWASTWQGRLGGRYKAQSEEFRGVVRDLAARGLDPNQIAAATGKSLTHTQRIYGQEVAAYA